MNDANMGGPSAPTDPESMTAAPPRPPAAPTERFGTRAAPREINVKIEKRGASLMRPGEALGASEDGVGTRAEPRNVSSSGGFAGRKENRVVSRAASSQIRRGATVGPSLPGGAASSGNVRQLRMPSSTAPREGIALARPTARREEIGEDVQALPTARHEELDELRAECPNPGERILIMQKGAAGALRTFLRTGTPIGRQFCPVILRVVADALSRPQGHAANWGHIEVPIVLLGEDVRHVLAATRRIRPSGEILRRLQIAVDRAFLAEKRLTDARMRAEGPSILDMVDGADGGSLPLFPQQASRGDVLPEHNDDNHGGAAE